MPIFSRRWLAAPLALVLAATSHAAAPTTLPSTRPASDTAPAEFAPPGDVSKASNAHAATAEELNAIADRVEAAAEQMDNRRYALHVREFSRSLDGKPYQSEQNGIAERRASGRRYEMWRDFRVRPPLRPGQTRFEQLAEVPKLVSGRTITVISPREHLAAIHNLPFGQARAFEGEWFELTTLSQKASRELRRALPLGKEDDPKLQPAAEMTMWLPPEPARYAFYGGEAQGETSAEQLAALARQLPDARDAAGTVQFAHVPRSDGDAGGDYEVQTIVYRLNTPSAGPDSVRKSTETRREWWFDPEQGGLLVFHRSLTDDKPTPYGRTICVGYSRAQDGAWLPAYAAVWRHPAPSRPDHYDSGRTASFEFSLAKYDDAGSNPAAGAFTWRDLDLRPGVDTLMLQSDDPARDGRFEVIDGELVDTAEAARRRRDDDEHGGL